MILLCETTIDPQAVLDAVQSPLAGAAILFLGTTRQLTDGRETQYLDYAGYESMAAQQLEDLRRQAIDRWELTGCCLVHRLGTVHVGEASVAVAVSAPHRQAAYEASQWLMDQIKQQVPIWKQEHWSDGTTEWVHPGTVPGPPRGEGAHDRSRPR